MKKIFTLLLLITLCFLPAIFASSIATHKDTVPVSAMFLISRSPDLKLQLHAIKLSVPNNQSVLDFRKEKNLVTPPASLFAEPSSQANDSVTFILLPIFDYDYKEFIQTDKILAPKKQQSTFTIFKIKFF